MDRITRLAQLVGLNSVPVVGVFFRSWSDSSAVVFYWCETALIVAFVALRLVLHRRATQKRGHYVEKRTRGNGGPEKKGVTTYSSSFLAIAGIFSLGNLVFIAVIFGLFPHNVNGGTVDPLAIREGALVAAGLLLVMFLIELPHLREQPFRAMRELSDAALRRVFVLYAAIFLGLLGAMLLHIPRAMFGVFFTLKLLVDLTSYLRPYDPAEPPAWLRRRNPAFAEEFLDARRERLAIAEEDEQTYDGRPSRFDPATGRTSSTA